jgi:hypothetical protein
MCYFFYGFPAHCPHLFVSSALGANMQSFTPIQKPFVLTFLQTALKNKEHVLYTACSRGGVN